MSTITSSVVLADDPNERAESVAVAGFLAGYSGAPRSSYATDLDTFASWCRDAQVTLFMSTTSPAPLALDRNELAAFLVQADLGSPRDHALASLLALNGLRISEALGADIEDLDFERGHRTLKLLRKGGKRATIPLAPRTSRCSTCISTSGPPGRSSSGPLRRPCP